MFSSSSSLQFWDPLKFSALFFFLHIRHYHRLLFIAGRVAGSVIFANLTRRKSRCLGERKSNNRQKKNAENFYSRRNSFFVPSFQIERVLVRWIDWGLQRHPRHIFTRRVMKRIGGVGIVTREVAASNERTNGTRGAQDGIVGGICREEHGIGKSGLIVSRRLVAFTHHKRLCDK